jgi:hypothetical protein
MNATSTGTRPARIDLTPFNQIGLDSGALGRLGAVVHRFDEPGHYFGVAASNGTPVGDFAVVVAEGAPPNALLDLTRVRRGRGGTDCGCGGVTVDNHGAVVSVAAGGHVTFHVGLGTGRWSTVVTEAHSGRSEFDSQRLDEGDLFAATILRPGSYSVRNAYSTEATSLAVRYVRPDNEPYRPGEPIRLRMGDRASRATVRLSPAQGLVFEATTETRVVIELREPDDGAKRG